MDIKVYQVDGGQQVIKVGTEDGIEEIQLFDREEPTIAYNESLADEIFGLYGGEYLEEMEYDYADPAPILGVVQPKEEYVPSRLAEELVDSRLEELVADLSDVLEHEITDEDYDSLADVYKGLCAFVDLRIFSKQGEGLVK